MGFKYFVPECTTFDMKIILSYDSGFPHSSVKNLPAMQETLVQFLGWEDPLETG